MALKHEKPNDALMGELIEVRDAAQKLGGCLQKTNWLPNNFEEDALKNMLASLRALPEGTAFAAQANLRVGKTELQNIEETYFRTNTAVTKDTDNQETSFLLRRSELGQSIIVLKGTIETALSQCRKQSNGDEAEDAPPDNEQRTNNQNNLTRPKLDEKLLSIEQRMHLAHTEISEIFVEGAPSREPLERIIQDTENLSRMMRATLALNSASKWVWSGLGRALKASPKALIKVMKRVKIANEIVRPLTKRWNDVQSDLTTFAHDQVDKTADAVMESAAIADAMLNHIPPPVDPKVQKAVEANATKLLEQNKSVPDDIALNVRNLNLGFSKFTKLELLNNSKWLQLLYLNSTQITDITALTGLDNLETLYLNGTQINDWSPVSHVENVYGRPKDWDA